MVRPSPPLVVVGQGLAGTLVALEAEAQGRDVVVIDADAGATATRAAAGLFNPLTGPRFTADQQSWDALVPFYRRLEQRLGVALVHPIDLVRPLAGAKIGEGAFPRAAPGWSANVEPGPRGPQVRIQGGGWVDLPALVDAARARWRALGRLEERRVGPEELRGRRVVWCGGAADLGGPVWGAVVARRWQPVRGDVLTVKIPGLRGADGWIGPRFLLPLGHDLYRWGATHESDVDDQGPRPGARTVLEDDLAAWLADRGGPAFEVVGHSWGVRPSSRNHRPLVGVHPDEPGWTLFNGLGGRGVVLGPTALTE